MVDLFDPSLQISAVDAMENPHEHRLPKFMNAGNHEKKKGVEVQFQKGTFATAAMSPATSTT